MTAKQKRRSERIAAEHLEPGDEVMLPDGSSYTVKRVQLGVELVRLTSEANRSSPGTASTRAFNVPRTTMFVRRARA